jgi:hypothetical protein
VSLALTVLGGIIVLIAGLLGGDSGALFFGSGLAACVLVAVVVSLPQQRTTPLEPRAESLRDPAFPGVNRLYSTVWLSATSARHVDASLRPVVQRILAAELEDRGPDAVRARIGERWWALIDPERPLSSDSQGNGLDRRSMVQLLEVLENR